MKLSDLKQMKRLNEQLSQAIDRAETDRKNLQARYDEAVREHNARLEKERKQRAELKAEMEDLTQQLRAREGEIRDLKRRIQDLESKVEEHIRELKNRQNILDEVTVQRDDLLRDLKIFQKERDDLHVEIERQKVEFESSRSQDLQHFEELMEERRRIEVILTQRETTITELNQTIKSLEATNNELETTVDSLQDKLEVLKDVKAQLVGAQAVNEELIQEKEKLRQELDTAGDFMLDLEQKVHKANNTSLELLRQLKDSENEIDALREYIVELKQRVAVNIPMKEDDVDKRLAEYINNYPDRSKLKIMFMRESEGIYLFGTRKIYVRVENNKIIIRVGGGYLTIDEFLDIYTPVELERLERKDPLKKFSEKVAVQRNLIGRELRESSPVRGSPTRSPVRSPNGRRSPRKSPRKSPKKSPMKH